MVITHLFAGRTPSRVARKSIQNLLRYSISLLREELEMLRMAKWKLRCVDSRNDIKNVAQVRADLQMETTSNLQ